MPTIAKSVQRLDRLFECCLVFHTCTSNRHAPDHHTRPDFHYKKRSGSPCVLTVASVNEPVIHACHRQTVLLFMSSIAAPISIRILTTCFVGSNLLRSDGVIGQMFDLTTLVSLASSSPGLSIIVSSPSLSVNGSNDRSRGHTGLCPPS